MKHPHTRPLPPHCAGFDQALNVILEECFERVFSTDMGMEQNPLGLYIIRGDNMCVAATAAAARVSPRASEPPLCSLGAYALPLTPISSPPCGPCRAILPSSSHHLFILLLIQLTRHLIL